MSRRGRALLLAAGLLLGLAVPGAAAPGCAALSSTRTGQTGTWTTYEVPDFGTGPATVTAHAVDGQRWLVTNGLVVLDSPDGGCTWKELVRLPEQPTREVPASRATDRIHALAAAGGRVLASVEVLGATGLPSVITVDEESPTDQPVTVVLTGTSSLAAGGPLAPPLGRPGALVLAPSDARTAYVVAGGRLQVSRDAGESWRPTTPPTVGSVEFPPRRTGAIAVDPHDAQELWMAWGAGVYGTSDAGSSWRRGVDKGFRGAFPLVAVGSTRGSAPRVSAVEWSTDAFGGLDDPLGLQQGDGATMTGAAFGPRGLGAITGGPQSLASSGPRDDLVMTTLAAGARGSEVYFLLQGRLLRVDEYGLGPLLDAIRARGGDYAFRSAGKVHRWAPDRPSLQGFVPPPVPPVRVGGIGTALPPLSPQTVLSSATSSLRLAPNGRARLPLRLDLSPEPTPLDVFFLVDTSGSMGDVVQGIAAAFADVANQLGQRRIDVQYGLGDYQDTNGIRYRRLLDISPPGEPLAKALESIRTGGGAEPAYTALHQVATGRGVEDPPQPQGQPVAPDQDATWRPGSLRLVIHATDEVPTEDPAGASRDEAVAALRADGARHIGLHVVRDQVASATGDRAALFDPVRLQSILDGLSEDTGGIAPPGGMDCNGDGKAEVAEGDPLVCRFVPGLLASRIELAGPLLRLLSTIVDRQPVDVAVEPAAAARTFDARLVARPAGTVDVKRPAQLDYVLQVSCSSLAYGTTRDLRLRPRVGDRVGTPLPLRVACDPVPGAPPAERVRSEFAFVAPVSPAVIVPALPPPPPPPAPVPAPAPAPAPAAAPGGVTAPVPGVAVAPDEGEVQLAFAEQQAEREVEELAMVAVDRRPDTAALRLLPLLAMTAAAAVVARRRQDAVAPRRTA